MVIEKPKKGGSSKCRSHDGLNKLEDGIQGILDEGKIEGVSTTEGR